MDVVYRNKVQSRGAPQEETKKQRQPEFANYALKPTPYRTGFQKRVTVDANSWSAAVVPNGGGYLAEKVI